MTTNLDDVLTDDRIESMRAQVMREVDADVAARKHRIKKLSAAAAVVIIAGGIGGTVFAALQDDSGGSSRQSAREAPLQDARARRIRQQCETLRACPRRKRAFAIAHTKPRRSRARGDHHRQHRHHR